MIPTVVHSWKDQTIKTVKRLILSKDLGAGDDAALIGPTQKIFSENSLIDTINVDMCHYRFVQFHRRYNTRSEL